MSSEDEDERRLQDVFKTSSSRGMFTGLATIPPIYVYISRIKNRLVVKTKDEYKLELQI